MRSFAVVGPTVVASPGQTSSPGVSMAVSLDELHDDAGGNKPEYVGASLVRPDPQVLPRSPHQAPRPLKPSRQAQASQCPSPSRPVPLAPLNLLGSPLSPVSAQHRRSAAGRFSYSPATYAHSPAPSAASGCWTVSCAFLGCPVKPGQVVDLRENRVGSVHARPRPYTQTLLRVTDATGSTPDRAERNRCVTTC